MTSALNSKVQSLMDMFGDANVLRKVTSTNLLLPNGDIVEDKKALVYADSGEYISTVGRKYQVINNEEVFLPTAKAVIDAGLDITDASVSTREGISNKRTLVDLKLPAHSITVGDKDESILQVLLRNSFDGSWKFQADVGAFRMACANGQVWGDYDTTYSNKHTAGFSVDKLASTLSQGLIKFGSMKDVWEKMAEQPVSQDEAQAVFINYCEKDFKGDDLKRSQFIENPRGPFKILTENWNKYSNEMGKTRWALYNSLTDHATHSSKSELSLVNNNRKITQLMAA